MVEVIVTWPASVAPEERDKINAEIGRVLRILLPYCSKIVYVDLEGVRMSVDENCIHEIQGLQDSLKYVEVEIE